MSTKKKTKTKAHHILICGLALSLAGCGGGPAEVAATATSVAPAKMVMPDLVGHDIHDALSDLVKAKIDFVVVGRDGVAFEKMLPLGSVKVEMQSISPGESFGPSDEVKLSVGTTMSETKAEVAARDAAQKAATEKAVADAKAAALDKAAADAKAAADKVVAEKAAAEAKAAADKAANERVVTYIVEADGPISGVTYTNFVGGQTGQEQAAAEVHGPITKEYRFSASDFNSQYSFYSLGVLAQASAATSSITCRILLNGVEVAMQSSTGPYSVVMCNKGG